MIVTEEWRDIVGWKDYRVSDKGNVMSLKKDKLIIRKPHDNGHGYLYVKLCNNKDIRKIAIHRLVAKAFIPNELNLPQVKS